MKIYNKTCLDGQTKYLLMRTFGKHFFRLWRNWGTMDCIYGTCFREWTIDMSNLCVFVYFRDLRLGKYVCMRSTSLCMRVHVLCCCSSKEHFVHAQKKHRSKFISWVGFVRTWKHFMWFSNSPGPRSGSAGFENSRVRDFSGPRVRARFSRTPGPENVCLCMNVLCGFKINQRRLSKFSGTRVPEKNPKPKKA